jgi:hypothetical protein
MVNQLKRENPGEIKKIRVENEDFVIADVKMSPEYRVELLTNSFT